MSTIEKTVEVDVPLKTAYNQWTQFESFPQFMDGVESVTQIGDTNTHWVVKVGPATREFDAEITEQTPDQVIAWRSTGGDTGGHTGRVRFEPLTPTSTRVNIELGWDPEGFVEKTGAALKIDQVQVDRSAAEFKRFIESRGTETGGWRGDVTGGVANEHSEDRHSTTGTTPSATFVGRASGDEAGGGEETGAERRADQHGSGTEGRPSRAPGRPGDGSGSGGTA